MPTNMGLEKNIQLALKSIKKSPLDQMRLMQLVINENHWIKINLGH